MTAKYEVIGSQTLTSSAASVTFSSIPGGYKDLVLVSDFLMTASGFVYGLYQFNGDTGANYSFVNAWGSGSVAQSSANTTNYGYLNGRFTADNAERTISNVSISDYSATDKHKSTLARNNRAGAGTEMFATRWANTSAITSILVFASGANFAATSTFHLYQLVSE